MDTFFSSLLPQATSLQIPVWLDLLAIIVGASFGAVTACERRLDLMGALGLGIVCGLGGGLIRDVTMQVGSVYMIDVPIAIPACLIASLFVFFFIGLFQKMDAILPWVDIISVGLFAASGADKAIIYNENIFVCLLMGTITGVGGGMLRDIVLGDVPHIFRPGNLYAICALAAAALYFVLVYSGVVKQVSAALAVAIAVLLRWLSLRYNLKSPVAVDLTPRVLHPIKTHRERELEKAEGIPHPSSAAKGIGPHHPGPDEGPLENKTESVPPEPHGNVAASHGNESEAREIYNKSSEDIFGLPPDPHEQLDELIAEPPDATPQPDADAGSVVSPDPSHRRRLRRHLMRLRHSKRTK